MARALSDILSNSSMQQTPWSLSTSAPLSRTCSLLSGSFATYLRCARVSSAETTGPHLTRDARARERAAGIWDDSELRMPECTEMRHVATQPAHRHQKQARRPLQRSCKRYGRPRRRQTEEACAECQEFWRGWAGGARGEADGGGTAAGGVEPARRDLVDVREQLALAHARVADEQDVDHVACLHALLRAGPRSWPSPEDELREQGPCKAARNCLWPGASSLCRVGRASATAPRTPRLSMALPSYNEPLPAAAGGAPLQSCTH